MGTLRNWQAIVLWIIPRYALASLTEEEGGGGC